MASELQPIDLFKRRFVQLLPWLNQHQTTLSAILALLLLAGSAWLVGAMVWLPVTDNSVSIWHAQLNDVNVSSQSSQTNPDTIKQRNLFGRYQEQSSLAVEKPVVRDAPQTRLSLTLVGVVSVEPQQKSLAIITNKGSQETYGLGEKIEGTGAKVIAVYPDRVVINNAGRDETLMLLDVEYSRLNRTEATSVPTPLKSSHVNYDEGRQSSVQTLADIKQQVAENPTQLFQYVRFSMLKRDGQIIGYQLSPGRSSELFDSVGLQKGDIAIKINGIELSDGNAVSQLMPLMQDLSEVNLTVERDGEPYEINIQF